jgi:Carboxypeptidase regulatory-like domain/TonB dependent receptor
MRQRVPFFLLWGAASSLLIAGTPLIALAQTDTGAIVGTVSDASGGVLPGVTVTATQDQTGVASSTTTNASGQFVFPSLRVGNYTLAAELQGFKRMLQRDVRISVQDRREVNFALDVGAVAEEVFVQGQSELLQTQSADIGGVVDERQIQDLPLLGRRYSELAFLVPGVVVAPAGITSRGEDTFFNANGNYATWNNYTLDGADNNSFSTNLQERSPQVVQPPVDALEEFKVQTRTYSAEFGKSAGAVVNASIKQGTNAFRGNLYEFFRDEALNANTWDNNRAGRAKGPFNQNIFGGTLGGPIARNRLFFFGDYQATRTERALSQTATVPTERMRTGDLSELTGTMNASNPFVPAGCLNAATKQIAPSCIDPVAARLMTLFPLPNVPGAGFFNNNFISNGILTSDIDQFDVRADYNAGNNDKVFARYSFQNTDRIEPPLLVDPVASGDFASNILIRGQNAVGGWSHIFGSSLFNEFRFGYNRVRSDSVHPAFGIDANAQYGITGVPQDPRFYGGLPHMPIARFARIGGPFFRPQFQTSQVYQFADHLTWNKARHTFKFGLERRRDLVQYIDLRSLNGELNFPDLRYTNIGLGDFLLGLSSVQRLTLFHEPSLYTDGWQVYAQDSWRARETLTVSYGLRYEYFTPLFDRDNLLTNIIPETGEIVRAQDSGSVYDRTLINPDRNDFAPRVGVVWSATPTVVVRGGYGLFYQQLDRYGSESQMGLNLPQLVDAAISANAPTDPPAFTFAQGFTPLNASTVNRSVVQWRLQDPNQRTPLVHQFSVGPEWQFAPNMVAAAEYVGNRTRNGRRIRNINQGIIEDGPTGSRVVYPYAALGYGQAFLQQIVSNGNADYDALQMRLQRRFADGLGFTVAYTWSSAEGDFLDHLSAGGGALGNTPQNAYDMAADYGPLPFDVPQRLVTSFIYELPWGVGRTFEPSGALGAIVRDWSVNGILTLSSGVPFTVTSADRANSGPGRYQRADCVSDPLPDGFDQTLNAWFDPTAFAQPALSTYGNCEYNSLRGPGYKSMNLSVFRSIPLPSERRVELRVETFNLFNWTNYGLPAANVSNLNTFGTITSTRGDNREIQLAVKFYF